MTSYEKNVLKIAGTYQYHDCHIVRAFVSIPELVRGGVNGYPVKLNVDGCPYTTITGQKYINPNDGFNPRICLFVWMEGFDQDNALCRWIVRFRLCDGSGFLRNQDYYQLKSLATAITGEPEAIESFDNFQMEDNDPLPRISAISRRLNACRDSYFSAADAIQQTTPSDPMTEKPKTFHSWAFKSERPSTGYQRWNDFADLEFLRFGDVVPITKLGHSLLDRLGYLHFTAYLSVVSYGPTGEGAPRKADTYTPMIDIQPTKNAGGYLFETPGLLPSDGFSPSISYQLINWSVRRGYDQLAGLWRTSESWGGSPVTPGPDFWCYWPTPVNPTVPFFGDDSWKRTDEIRGYWRSLRRAGADLEPDDRYAPVVLPKIKATPKIDSMIDFGHVSEVRLAEKLYGKKFIN